MLGRSAWEASRRRSRSLPASASSAGSAARTGGSSAAPGAARAPAPERGSGQDGVGVACASTGDCRAGLDCDPTKNVCEPAHSTPSGGTCILSDECKAGLYCAAAHCTKGGTGLAGATCAGNGDCAAGLVCTLVGLGAECAAEGSGDVGATCKTGSDCFGGLVCVGGACTLPSPGLPFGPPPWPGVTCSDPTGPALAYFEVPRATGNGDFYRLPFPNDIRLVNGKLQRRRPPTLGAGLLGYDLVARYLAALGSDNDGWGLYPTTFFRFSTQIDIKTLDGNVSLVNLTTGSGLTFFYSYSIGGGAYICPNWVGVRQGEGGTYTEGQTYAAILTTSIQATGGAPISPSSDFTAMLAASAPKDATLAVAWSDYAPLRAYLTKQSTAPSTILNAAVFTIGHPTAPLLKLEAVIDAAPPPVATKLGLAKCDTGVTTPCPDATGDRACPAADPAIDELDALGARPLFQSGTAPYLTPAQGGALSLDSSGAPTVVATQPVCMSLTVPKGTPPAAGWPTLVFAHATGGDFRSAVTAGLAKDFATGVDDGTGTKIQAAVLGIDQVQTGPRRNGSTQSPADLYFNYANPAAAKGNVQQGAADQISLLRFIPTVTFTAATSPTGAAFTLGGPVAFWGHALGAAEGALALPFGAYGGAVLSGQSASLIDTLLTKTNPVNLAAAVPFALQDVGADGKLNGGQDHPVLSLLQTYMDGSDPLAYAALAAATPPTGVTAHHLFQPYGLGDTYAPPVTQATYALAATLGLVAADPSVKTPDPIGMLATIPTPASGNLMVAGKPVSALIREYQPASTYDGDLVAFDLASARADAERFLAGVMSGIVPQVGK